MSIDYPVSYRRRRISPRPRVIPRRRPSVKESSSLRAYHVLLTSRPICDPVGAQLSRYLVAKDLSSSFSLGMNLETTCYRCGQGERRHSGSGGPVFDRAGMACPVPPESHARQRLGIVGRGGGSVPVSIRGRSRVPQVVGSARLEGSGPLRRSGAEGPQAPSNRGSHQESLYVKYGPIEE